MFKELSNQEEIIELMMNLYDEETGEIPEENLDAYAELVRELETSEAKTENLLVKIRNIIKQESIIVEGIKEEIKRLNKVKKSKENLIDTLKIVFLHGIKSIGSKTKTGGFTHDFGLFKAWTSKSINAKFEDEELFNDTNYITYNMSLSKLQEDEKNDIIKEIGHEDSVTKTIDKDAVTRALKAGLIIEGVELKETEFSVIK